MLVQVRKLDKCCALVETLEDPMPFVFSTAKVRRKLAEAVLMQVLMHHASRCARDGNRGHCCARANLRLEFFLGF